MRIMIVAGQSSQAFCHTMKWSNVKIYYSYYYKYIYKKRNHFYLWILQGRIDLVNKVLSHVCTYLFLIRKWSLLIFLCVPFWCNMKKENYMKTIALYCTVIMKNNLCCEYTYRAGHPPAVYSGVVYHCLSAKVVNDVS